MEPPRHQLIADTLRGKIRSGYWQVGEVLPSEAELCQEWGVSRGPVRQALAALREEGLISLSRGKPPIVRKADAEQTLVTFTPFSQWARSSGRRPGSKTLEVSKKRASVEVAAALEIPPDSFVVSVIRARYLDDEPTMLERSVFRFDVGHHLLEYDTDTGSLTEFLTGKGVTFASIRHVLDAVAADTLDASALGIGVGAPLLRERRTTLDAQGKPFEFADDRYRPEIVTFSITNALTADLRMVNPAP
jgi:GntR family transcriptional regulator